MVHNITDITPAGTATALSSTHTRVGWITFSAPAANSGEIRVGDSTTSATSGATVFKGTNYTMLPVGDDNYLDIALVFVYGTSSDKVGVLWGSH